MKVLNPCYSYTLRQRLNTNCFTKKNIALNQLQVLCCISSTRLDTNEVLKIYHTSNQRNYESHSPTQTKGKTTTTEQTNTHGIINIKSNFF